MKRRGFIKTLSLALGLVPVVSSMTFKDVPVHKLASDIDYENRRFMGMVIGKRVNSMDKLTIVIRGCDELTVNDLVYAGDQEYQSSALVVAIRKVDNQPTFEAEVISVKDIQTIEEAEYFANSFKFRSTLICYRKYAPEN